MNSIALATADSPVPVKTEKQKKKNLWKREGEKDPTTYKVKHHAVNAEYIMEGVVNVKIVDVDPSQQAARKKEASERKIELTSTKSTTALTGEGEVAHRGGFFAWCWPRQVGGRRRCCGFNCC